MREVSNKAKLDITKSIYDNWVISNKDNMELDAIEYLGVKKSYNEVSEMIDLYAGCLQALNLSRGAMITFCMLPLTSMFYAFYAANKLGITANFISNTLIQSEGGRRFIDDTNSEIIFIFDKFFEAGEREILKSKVKYIVKVSLFDNVPENHYIYQRDVAAMATNANGHAGKLAENESKEAGNDNKVKCFTIKEFENLYIGSKKDTAEDISCVYSDSEKKENLTAENGEIVTGLDAGDRLAVILYSGGSTGIPKGVEKTNSQIVSMGNIHLDKDTGLFVGIGERNGVFIPPNHPTAFVHSIICPCFFGTCQVLQPRYDKRTFPSDVVNLKLDFAVAAPSHYAMFINADLPANALSHLRLPVCGGEPVPKGLYEKINKRLLELGAKTPLTVAYGMSELGPLAVMTVGRRAGKVIKGARARIVDEKGKDLGSGKRGRLEISFPGLQMKRYYRDEEKTAEFFTSDGYARTGDIAIIDKDGYIDILGRADDCYYDKKENLHYNFDIENVINEINGVKEAEVIASKGSGNFEGPIAFVVLEDTASSDICLRISHKCSLLLPKEEVPVKIVIINEFATNPISHKRDTAALLKTLCKNRKMKENFY